MLADASGTLNSRRCSSMQKCFYGLGHIYNDLCAAMWFSYTLFYFQIVLQMDSKTAGILLMLGQVVDSLATPVAGCVVDRTGARRAWHIAGTLAVSIGFTLIFSLQPATFTSWVLVYYAGVITLFQVGWAVVQISHLSMLPEISMNHSSSSDLTAIRYTASVCCSISIYVITLIILKNGNDQNNIGPEDFYKFKEIALLITFIGLISCSLFYCGMLSKPDYQEIVEDDPQDDANELSTKGKITHFLKSSITYQVSLMYMASRLFTTLNLIYIPLYLEERDVNTESTDDGIRQTIATVPLVSYLSSFLMAIILKYRPKGCNDKIAYLTGAIISLISSLWIGVGVFSSSHIEIYFIASLIGIGGSSTMVSSLCLTANFVKTNGYGGGSVYSMVTFTDKLISGMVVLIVQNVLECAGLTVLNCKRQLNNTNSKLSELEILLTMTIKNAIMKNLLGKEKKRQLEITELLLQIKQCTPKNLCPNFYQHVLGFVGMGVIIIGLLSLISLHWKVGRNGGSM